MTWLRIDDGFDRHPKVTALPRGERWTWIGLLCYSARYKTDGYLPVNVAEHVKGASPRFIIRLVELGLLDVPNGDLRIHDWERYCPKDPTKTERQAKWRRKKTSTEPSTEPSTSSSTEVSTSRARSPSRPLGVSNDTPADELWDVLEVELGEAVTASERGRRNKALKELRDIGATPDEVRKRCKAYRRMWPDITLTAAALAANWTTLMTKELEVQPIEAVLELPDISDEDRAVNLERIRELSQAISQEAV